MRRPSRAMTRSRNQIWAAISGTFAQPQAPAPQTQGRTANLPQIEVVRVRPIDATNPQFRLGDGPVDLMRDFSLSSSRGIGASWETPA
jgi:hypothetical protein